MDSDWTLSSSVLLLSWAPCPVSPLPKHSHVAAPSDKWRVWESVRGQVNWQFPITLSRLCMCLCNTVPGIHDHANRAWINIENWWRRNSVPIRSYLPNTYLAASPSKLSYSTYSSWTFFHHIDVDKVFDLSQVDKCFGFPSTDLCFNTPLVQSIIPRAEFSAYFYGSSRLKYCQVNRNMGFFFCSLFNIILL